MDVLSCNFKYESVVFGYGGSICALDMSNVSIQNSTFMGCLASLGGSITVMSGSTANIEYSRISESLANKTAGAVYVNHESTVTATNISILNSSSASGGAISCEESLLDLHGGILSDNKALVTHGGGFLLDNCKAVIDNFTFTYNTALQYGGGLYVKSSFIKHCIPFIDKLTLSYNVPLENCVGLYGESKLTDIHNIRASENRAGLMGGFMMITNSKFKGHNLVRIRPMLQAATLP